MALAFAGPAAADTGPGEGLVEETLVEVVEPVVEAPVPVAPVPAEPAPVEPAPVAPVPEDPAPEAPAPQDLAPVVEEAEVGEPAPPMASARVQTQEQESVEAEELGAAAQNDDPKKVFVCKYVGTPGDGERLQTGKNPVSVSINTIGDAEVGEYFADGQNRSYVLAYDLRTGGGQEGEPSIGDCPPPDTGMTEVTPTLSFEDAMCPDDFVLVGGSIMLGTEDGITYVVTLDGEVVTDLSDLGPGEYVVTASLEEGYEWGELGAGWMAEEDGTAVYVVTISDIPCAPGFVEVTPSVTVVDAVCPADFVLVGGSITVGSEAGITYVVTLDGVVVTDLTDLGPGEYVVTASLDEDYMWGEELGEGWLAEDDGTAVYVVEISDVPCELVPGTFGPDVTVTLPVCVEEDDELFGAVDVILDNTGSTSTVWFLVWVDDEDVVEVEIDAGKSEVVELYLEDAGSYVIVVEAFGDDVEDPDTYAAFETTVVVDCAEDVPTKPVVNPVIKPVVPAAPVVPTVTAPRAPTMLAYTGTDGASLLLLAAAGLIGLGGLGLAGARLRGRLSS